MLTSTAALTDPPDHAKAHGWRKKHDPQYVGYTGRNWDQDYGISAGSCHRKEIGTVLGAVAGGAVGSQIGDGSGRTVAIVVGSVLGAIIGREIGADLDDADRGCVGHALELAKPGQTVRWVNDSSGVSYLIEPLATTKRGDSCRNYKLTASRAGKSRTSEKVACRSAAGTWQVQ
jgi:surface antigen